jgi:hypothetical protein
METNYRKNMGLIDEDEHEECVTTQPASANGSYCRLGLEAPILQCEVPRSKRVIKFYFGVHIIVPSTVNTTEYYICHGDQFHSDVFIAAIHEEGTPIPFAFLCVSADSYIAWMFPEVGLQPIIPCAEAWCIQNSMDFCLSNIKHDLPSGETTGLTIHIPTTELFEEKAVKAIEQIASAKQSGEYASIFNLAFLEEEVFPEDDGSNGNEPPKNKKGSRAPPVAAQSHREKFPKNRSRGGRSTKI